MKSRRTRRHRRTRRRGGTCGSCMMQSGAGLSISRPAKAHKGKSQKKKKTRNPRHMAMIALEHAALAGDAEKVREIMDNEPQLENGDFGIVIDSSALTAEVREILDGYQFFITYNH